MVSWLSRTRVLTLLWERRAAQDNPARPDPITITSVVVGIGSDAFGLWNAWSWEVVCVLLVGGVKAVLVPVEAASRREKRRSCFVAIVMVHLGLLLSVCMEERFNMERLWSKYRTDYWELLSAQLICLLCVIIWWWVCFFRSMKNTSLFWREILERKRTKERAKQDTTNKLWIFHQMKAPVFSKLTVVLWINSAKARKIARDQVLAACMQVRLQDILTLLEETIEHDQKEKRWLKQFTIRKFPHKSFVPPELVKTIQVINVLLWVVF